MPISSSSPGGSFAWTSGAGSGPIVGGECHQAGWVERRQVIRIGPYRLRLDAGDGEQWASSGADANGGASQFPEASSLPRLFLELWDRSDEPSVWQIERELTLIGTSADCEVRVLDPSVSAHHCSLLRTSTGIWVVDLLGIDGVMVNGTAVRYARVYDGDELHLGNALIRLRYELPRQWAVPSAQLAGSGMMALHSPPGRRLADGPISPMGGPRGRARSAIAGRGRPPGPLPGSPRRIHRAVARGLVCRVDSLRRRAGRTADRILQLAPVPGGRPIRPHAAAGPRPVPAVDDDALPIVQLACTKSRRTSSGRSSTSCAT